MHWCRHLIHSVFVSVPPFVFLFFCSVQLYRPQHFAGRLTLFSSACVSGDWSVWCFHTTSNSVWYIIIMDFMILAIDARMSICGTQYVRYTALRLRDLGLYSSPGMIFFFIVQNPASCDSGNISGRAQTIAYNTNSHLMWPLWLGEIRVIYRGPG